MTIQVLEKVVGTTNKVRILRVMVTLTRSISGREAARLAGVSSKAILALDELAAVGLVTKREGTGQFLYSFNRKNALAKPLASLFKAEERRTEELYQAIRAALSNKPGVLAIAMFGSTARGEARPQSDVDLFVIVEDPQQEDAVYDALLDSAKRLWERYGARISPVVLSESRWLKQVEDGDPFTNSVLREAVLITGVIPTTKPKRETRKQKAD
jgi:predicted nucleotidyltransferase